MTYRYIFGNPDNLIKTDAILEKPAPAASDQMPYLVKQENGYFYRMADKDIVYGLGENVRGINKRGWEYISNCSDEPNHREDTRSLYGAHNFIIIDGSQVFGIFVDTPGKITFDIGYTRYDELIIRPVAESHEIYILTGETPDEIVTCFRNLIGRSYLPPKWAFGYGQSRWSYFSSDEVRQVAQKHRDNGIPLDSIYLDIDYMERYKDFTIDRQKFGDFEQLVEEMKADGIHLIPIIDAGIKIEEGYDVYEEGLAKGYFCKDEAGKEFIVGVWPGKCVFPDMLNEEARAWFGDQYETLLAKGIDGFWNDMNEPAVFYSEKKLRQVFNQIAEYQKMNLDIQTFFEFQNLVSTLAGNEEDYQSFYHNYQGKRIRHDKVHNLFGCFMTRSAGEAFERLSPDKRILMFSRASYIGMHRYGGIWMGDNMSWWSHLKMNLQMLPSLNMCGFLYAGADIGGFNADTTEDLMLRWLALGIFTPLMRNHSAKGTRYQEVYQFHALDQFKGLISLRYRLLPYIYSEFMKAALKGTMYCRPLGFIYRHDEIARRTEDQLLIGDSIMIAPVCEQNAGGRVVYCPENMKMLRFKGAEVTEEVILAPGHHYIPVMLDEVILFIRPDHILPLAQPAAHVNAVDFLNLTLYHFAQTGTVYELYHDMGEEREVDLNSSIIELKI